MQSEMVSELQSVQQGRYGCEDAATASGAVSMGGRLAVAQNVSGSATARPALQRPELQSAQHGLYGCEDAAPDAVAASAGDGPGRSSQRLTERYSAASFTTGSITMASA